MVASEDRQTPFYGLLPSGKTRSPAADGIPLDVRVKRSGGDGRSYCAAASLSDDSHGTEGEGGKGEGRKVSSYKHTEIKEHKELLGCPGPSCGPCHNWP